MNMKVHIEHAHITVQPGLSSGSAVSIGDVLSDLGGISVPPLAPQVGEAWSAEGGVLAGIMPSEDGKPAYYLIVSTDEAAEAKALKWGPYGTSIDGLSTWDGKANTEKLAAAETDHPAAEFCAGLELGGHCDWYMPSRREASMIAATVPQLFPAGAWYWSSTQYSANSAFYQHFTGGNQNYGNKSAEARVRAVRRFLID